jgi:ketosteroid isomerase-like protein
MRRLSLALVLGAAPLYGCPAERPSQRPSTPTVEDEAEIHAVLTRQKEAWNRGDIETFMEGYHRSPDIVFTSGGKIRRGFDETLARYREKYVAGDAMGHLDFTDVTLQPVGADGAVALGTWRLTETPKAGEGVFTLVLTKVDGRWGIVHDHTSSAVP